MPDRMPEDMPDRLPGGMPDKVPEGMPDKMPDRMPEDMPDNMPEDMPGRMPEGMPDRMPEDMPDKAPECLPDRMPEDLPDRMAEDMFDRMPEDMPVTKCINVMVGITRSKVILSNVPRSIASNFMQCRWNMWNCLWSCKEPGESAHDETWGWICSNFRQTVCLLCPDIFQCDGSNICNSPAVGHGYLAS